MKQKMWAGILMLSILTLQGCSQTESEPSSDIVQDVSQMESEPSSDIGQDISQTESESVSDDVCISDTEQPVTPIELDFTADVNHNGVEDVIEIRGSGRYGYEVTLSVMEDGKELYSTYTILNAGMGQQFYLVHQNGKDYIMRYSPQVDHGIAFCEYEVFSLDENAEVIAEAYESIEVSLFDADEIDIPAWTAFAERENVYFADAILMLSTSEGELVCGDTAQPIRYTERYAWMIFITEPSQSIEQNLKSFIEEQKDYWQLKDSQT